MARRLAEVAKHHLVPNWFTDALDEHRLETAEILTFLAMCGLCDRDRLVTAPQSQIAAYYRMSRRAVQDALPELVKRGFLVDLGAPASRRPRHYRVAEAKPLPPAPAYPSNVRALHDGMFWKEAR